MANNLQKAYISGLAGLTKGGNLSGLSGLVLSPTDLTKYLSTSNAEKFGQILREGMAEQDRKDAHKVLEMLWEYDRLPKWKRIIHRIKRRLK